MTRCVRIREAGGPEVLQIETLELRAPGPHEVRVAVRAAGLNRADCLQRKGVYPAPLGVPSDVPGLELAGVVEEVGSQVRNVQVGERVMAITAGAAMAEHAILHARECLAIPESLDFAQAAAIPEAFLTAFDALRQGAQAAGERVLIHAAGSGVGTAAIQLVALQGGVSIGTSRTPAKLERAAELGLAHGIAVSEGAFAAEVRALGGADLILDFVGAAYLDENLKALNARGRIVHIGLLGGASAKINLGRVLQKRASLIGTVLRSRPIEEKLTLVQAFRKLLPHFVDGRLAPVLQETRPMEDIQQAHAQMERGELFGKIVMTW